MRRYIVSPSTINRIISHNKRMQADEHRNNLIQANQYKRKELDPQYEIKQINFDIETRIAKIEFIETKKYRTIERYVTQNYNKYPVYSDWKEKSKSINKTIKLTNEALESLNSNEDFLIKKFSKEIILQINNENLFPSWFVLYCLEDEYREKSEEIEYELIQFTKNMNLKLNKLRTETNNTFNSINTKEIDKKQWEEALKKTNKKIDLFSEQKNKFLLSVGTILFVSVLIMPSLSLTQVAIAVLPRIITPSIPA